MTTIKSSIVSVFRVYDNEFVGVGGTENRNVSRLDSSKNLNKSNSQTKSGQLGNSNTKGELKFLISKAKEIFNYLKQAFTKVPIFRHFNLECHIRIEIDASGYIIKRVLN